MDSARFFLRTVGFRHSCSLLSTSLATRNRLILAARRQLSIGNVAAKPGILRQRSSADKRTFLSYDLPSLRLVCDQGKQCSMLMRSSSSHCRPCMGLCLASSSTTSRPACTNAGSWA